MLFPSVFFGAAVAPAFLIVSVSDASLQFALVIFGVSLAWALYTSMEHYPRIHRFGYMWYKPLAKPEGRVLLLSWAILMGISVGSLYSIYSSMTDFESRLHDTTDVWTLPVLGVVAFYYAYVPYLANRLILGVLALIAPQDLEYFVNDTNRYNLYVAPRMSRRTVDLFLHR